MVAPKALMDRMSRPIQIYLDSSDYSRLSLAETCPEVMEIKETLLKYARDGRVNFRYSAISVLEAAPVRLEDLDLGCSRIRCIYELCGKHSLIDPESLLRKEINNLIKGASAAVEAKSNKGYWTPSFNNIDLISMKEVKEIIRAEIRKEIPGLSRNQMRKMISSKSGIVSKLNGDIFSEMSSRYPVNNAVFMVLKRYILGSATHKQVVDALKDSFAELDLFAKLYETHWSDVSKPTGWLRVEGRKLREAFDTFQQEIKSLYLNAEMHGFDIGFTKGVLKSEREKLEKKFIGNVVDRITASVAGRKISVSPPSWELSPSLLSMISLFIEKIRIGANNLNIKKLAKNSDFGDVAHALYLPYVDVFRCDAATGELIRRVNPPLDTSVVSKLDGLIPEIERKLSST
ncbi:hypothetical protein QK430_04790 [Pseudomonas aeruginosa]|uniref:hypothetical protein n=1 Tax=Pseudomonas aeruginosa TaxID=287 RepID=UPI001114DFCF|nr:hypothetical protein [Pseudomonas aeruginosa]MDI3939343.1 hypothetical protein [Pseudomonas aeruginosa]MDI3989169.1 hypothetical protein [Pseudomonas aeruginosa]